MQFFLQYILPEHDWLICILQRVRALHGFWVLKTILIRKICVSGTVLKMQLTQKSPFCRYLSQTHISEGISGRIPCTTVPQKLLDPPPSLPQYQVPHTEEKFKIQPNLAQSYFNFCRKKNCVITMILYYIKIVSTALVSMHSSPVPSWC